MYQFNKVQDVAGVWRFELDGINLLLDDFTVKDGKHWITNPNNAIAYFDLGGHIYGVGNQIITYNTAEDFFDSMLNQYRIFRPGGSHPILMSATNNTPQTNNNHFKV